MFFRCAHYLKTARSAKGTTYLRDETQIVSNKGKGGGHVFRVFQWKLLLADCHGDKVMTVDDIKTLPRLMKEI